MILPPAQQTPKELALLERVKSLRQAMEMDTLEYRARRQEWLDYYFGRQWSPTKRAKVEARGQDVRRVNRVRPTARLLWGLLTTAPLDIVLRGQTPESNDIAEVFQAVVKMNETQNNVEWQETMVAFQGIVAGEGWSYLGPYVRDSNPTTDIVQERFVDCREIMIDKGTRMGDASDMTYLDWGHTVNQLDLAASFPNKAKCIMAAAGLEQDPTKAAYSMPGYYTGDQDPYSNNTAYVWTAYDHQAPMPERHVNQDVVVHEFWEYRPVKVIAVQQPGMNTPDVYDEDDKRLPEALLTCKRYWTTTQRVPFCTIYIDNAVLATFRSRVKHRKIPFVRFVFELDDRFNPVSLVDDLTDIQDGVNEFRTRIAYELATRWWFVDPTKAGEAGKRSSLDELQDQLEGDDGGVVFVNPDSVREVNNMALIGSLHTMMEESKSEIQFTSGINQEQMGYPNGQQSGKAKQVAISQSQVIQRPVEVNWISYKTTKAELRISLIQQYHDSEFIVSHTDADGAPVYYTVNQQAFDASGKPVVLTDITKARYHIGIDVAPATAANKDKAVALFNDLAVNEPDLTMRNTYKKIALEIGGLPFKRRFLKMVDEAQQRAQQAQEAAAAPPQGPATAQPPQEAVGQQMRG